MRLPDIHTLQDQHPELYKLIAGHISYAKAPTNEATAMAMYVRLRLDMLCHDAVMRSNTRAFTRLHIRINASSMQS